MLLIFPFRGLGCLITFPSPVTFTSRLHHSPDVFDAASITYPQAMFTKAGVKGQGVGFLFTDNQIVQERFLVRLQTLRFSRQM